MTPAAETPIFWALVEQLRFLPARPASARLAWDEVRGHLDCDHALTVAEFRRCVNARIAARARRFVIRRLPNHPRNQGTADDLWPWVLSDRMTGSDVGWFARHEDAVRGMDDVMQAERVRA